MKLTQSRYFSRICSVQSCHGTTENRTNYWVQTSGFHLHMRRPMKTITLRLTGTSESDNRMFELLNRFDPQPHHNGFKSNRYEKHIFCNSGGLNIYRKFGTLE